LYLDNLSHLTNFENNIDYCVLINLQSHGGLLKLFEALQLYRQVVCARRQSGQTVLADASRLGS
jgi:hypothetical protein